MRSLDSERLGPGFMKLYRALTPTGVPASNPPGVDRLVKLRATSPHQHNGRGHVGTFSVFVSFGDVFVEGADQPQLVETVPAPLTWRQVLKFIRKRDMASGSLSDRDLKFLHLALGDCSRKKRSAWLQVWRERSIAYGQGVNH
jgi:hypothetical protein